MEASSLLNLLRGLALVCRNALVAMMLVEVSWTAVNWFRYLYITLSLLSLVIMIFPLTLVSSLSLIE